MNITDIHMHVVPDVDDGSRSLEESISLLERSVTQGVRTVIATPHSWGIDHCGSDHMLSRFGDLKKAVRDREIPIKLYLGCEMLVYRHTVENCIRKLDDGRYPTMVDSRSVLTEFDPYESRSDMEACIQRILEAEFVPVIAHVERYHRITADDVRALKDLGALIQINAYSIANEADPQIRQLANDCLSERMVDFLGSDAHRLNHRPPVIGDGISALIERYSEEYAKLVTEQNPQNLLIASSAAL